jgi:hypothetical protein
MAKGDICRIEDCKNVIRDRGLICNAHRQRWKKYKSYSLPPRIEPLAGYVKVCLIHGQLKPEDCLIRKKASARNAKNTIRNSYNCKACSQDRYHRWFKRHPDKRKEDYEKVKDKESQRIKYYAQRLKVKYGMTLQQYNDLLEKQNHSCAICGAKEYVTDGRYKRIRRLGVDHCHVSEAKGIMKIRAILCNRCNAALGMLEDSVGLLKKLIAYLLRHQE